MLKSILRATVVAIATSGSGIVAAQDFRPCNDSMAFAELVGSQCARTPVPLDHANGPGGATVELFVRKFPAVGPSRGTVWLVAGGPGESGASFYPFLDTLRRSFPDRDLMVPDHRGTGYSTKLCPVEEAVDSEDGIALAGSEWGGCIGALHGDPVRAAAFSITQAAHDLSQLVDRYRGDGTTHVYGVSYGTQLVLRMMRAAPPRVDGLILDSLVPPERSDQWDLSHRSQVTDAVGRQVLGSEGEVTYRRLLVAAEANPAWLERIPGQNLKAFMGTLLDYPTLRGRMPVLIEELGRGETTTLDRTLADLKALTARFGRYPQSPSSLPLVMVISGSENNARPDLTPATIAEEAKGLVFTSPLGGYLAGNPMPLYARDGLFGDQPASLPPTLVLQGTLDPKTPYAGAAERVGDLASLAVTLVAVEGAPHFILFTAPTCFESRVRSFVNHQPVADRCVSLLDENATGT